tara:strand:+ start:178 stop:483 length:306 start_codon:yes stop_codon:yes gene_type:complete
MVAQKLLYVVSLQPFSAVCPFIFTIMNDFNDFDVPRYDPSLSDGDELPLLDSPNNTQFYGSGIAGAFIGNLVTQGIKTTARLWSNGKQTKINARKGQFNIF